MGRKSKYETHVVPYLDEIKRWKRFWPEWKIADELDVTQKTFIKYKNEHKELQDCLKKGVRDTVISLYEAISNRAHGCKTKDKKTVTKEKGGEKEVQTEEIEREYPPDVAAIHLMLKNLDKNWRNDDKPTMDLKREQLELAKKKQEEAGW